MKPNVLATCHEWLPGMAERLTRRTGSPFHLLTSNDELTAERLAAIGPARVYLPHWSHKIPAEVYEAYECVIFHMTDVPFGRGGSPLQNLIARGIYETRISALRCVAELDAGPVYLKRDFSVGRGASREMYAR